MLSVVVTRCREMGGPEPVGSHCIHATSTPTKTVFFFLYTQWVEWRSTTTTTGVYWLEFFQTVTLKNDSIGFENMLSGKCEEPSPEGSQVECALKVQHLELYISPNTLQTNQVSSDCWQEDILALKGLLGVYTWGQTTLLQWEHKQQVQLHKL